MKYLQHPIALMIGIYLTAFFLVGGIILAMLTFTNLSNTLWLDWNHVLK